MQEKMGPVISLPEAIAINRDFQDKMRVIGALKLTDDAIIIDTSHLTSSEQTVKKSLISLF
jgi:cytidylate kinase